LAEIVPVVSEALEAQVRNLLPSQRGFGEDLQASNVIMPIIDLTSAAEGSSVPESLQQAWDFSTEHTQRTAAGTDILINTTGFWKIDLNCSILTSGAGLESVVVDIFDGTTAKEIFVFSEQVTSTGNAFITATENAFIAFARAGDSIRLTATANTQTDVWYRQVADVSGVLTNPLGFTPQ
jgi:hypothetical protein